MVLFTKTLNSLDIITLQITFNFEDFEIELYVVAKINIFC